MPNDSDSPTQPAGPGIPSTSASHGSTAPRGESAPPTPSTPPRAAETPTPAHRAGKGSISRAAWFALIVGLVVLILLLVFILQNNTSARFSFWAATFTLPLGVAMLFAAIAGALITALVGTTRMIALGRTVRRLEHQRGEQHRGTTR